MRYICESFMSICELYSIHLILELSWSQFTRSDFSLPLIFLLFITSFSICFDEFLHLLSFFDHLKPGLRCLYQLWNILKVFLHLFTIILHVEIGQCQFTVQIRTLPV